MQSSTQAAPVSKKRLRAGRIMSALPALFLLVDGVVKLVKPAPVVEATVRLGYPESVLLGLGVVLTGCVILYVISRTSVLGAILLTAYLGGASASLSSRSCSRSFSGRSSGEGFTCATGGCARSSSCEVSLHQV